MYFGFNIVYFLSDLSKVDNVRGSAHISVDCDDNFILLLQKFILLEFNCHFRVL